MASEVEFPPAEEHCAQLMSQMFSLLKNRSLCDSKIIVENEEFWAHKCVLVAASPTLHDIIMQESQNTSRQTIQLTLQGLSASGFKALLSYIYTGEPPNVKKGKEGEDFRRACHALAIHLKVPKKNVEQPADLKGEGVDVELVVEVTTCPEYDENFGGLEELHDHSYTHGDSAVEDAGDDYRVETDDSIESHDEAGEPLSKKRKRKAVVMEDFVGYGDDEGDEGFDDPSQEKENPSSLIANGQPIQDVVIKEEIMEGFTMPQLRRGRKPKNGRAMVKRKGKGRRGRPLAANDEIFPREPPYVCPYGGCSKVCPDRPSVKKHYRNHSARTHVCDMCGKGFLYPKDLMVHRRTHTGEKPHKCGECGASFAQNSTLKNHLASHLKERNHICDMCGRAYTAKRSLLLHKSEKHSGKVKDYRCIHCGKVSCSRSAHLLHVRTECNSACFLCPKCGRKYRREEPYKAHQEKCNGIIEFQCEFCKKSFKSDKNLRNHVQSFHTKTLDITEVIASEIGDVSAATDAVAAAVSAVGGVEPTPEDQVPIAGEILLTEMILVNIDGKEVVSDDAAVSEV